jgi:hypothetical protein
MEDIKTAVAIGVDYLAVSFPRSAADMNLARKLVKEAGGDIHLVAKIERAEAVEEDKVLDEIILASDAVMVARGDLGVEIGDARLTTGAAGHAGMAEAVVSLALVGVAEHGVGLRGVLEVLLGRFVARVPVRMVLQRLPAVGALDLRLASAALDAKDLV